ncbi:hypothetical protein [Mycolicibacterium doricum]|nr:hypothetical protein [Mycolicibacterium doricum]
MIPAGTLHRLLVGHVIAAAGDHYLPRMPQNSPEGPGSSAL